jgi:hypothetical protein
MNTLLSSAVLVVGLVSGDCQGGACVKQFTPVRNVVSKVVEFHPVQKLVSVPVCAVQHGVSKVQHWREHRVRLFGRRCR